MAWKGFLTESKSYMNYPRCGRFYFWMRVPGAFIKYHWCCMNTIAKAISQRLRGE